MVLSIVLRSGEIPCKREDRRARSPISPINEGGRGWLGGDGFDVGSKFRHFETAIEGTAEIEPEWTAQKREELGLRPKLRSGPVIRFPPWQSQDGASLLG